MGVPGELRRARRQPGSPSRRRASRRPWIPAPWRRRARRSPGAGAGPVRRRRSPPSGRAVRTWPTSCSRPARSTSRRGCATWWPARSATRARWSPGGIPPPPASATTSVGRSRCPTRDVLPVEAGGRPIAVVLSDRLDSLDPSVRDVRRRGPAALGGEPPTDRRAPGQPRAGPRLAGPDPHRRPTTPGAGSSATCTTAPSSCSSPPASSSTWPRPEAGRGRRRGARRASWRRPRPSSTGRWPSCATWPAGSRRRPWCTAPSRTRCASSRCARRSRRPCGSPATGEPDEQRRRDGVLRGRRVPDQRRQALRRGLARHASRWTLGDPVQDPGDRRRARWRQPRRHRDRAAAASSTASRRAAAGSTSSPGPAARPSTRQCRSNRRRPTP